MDFVYPLGLISRIKERWNQYHGPRKVQLVASGRGMKRSKKKTERIDPGSVDTLPFPADKSLLAFLEALYHSSFLIEEGRRISLRVAYLPQSLSSENLDRVLNHHGSVTRLQPARLVSPSELLRLAPAVDPSQSMLLIEEGRQDGTLVVWGLLHLGSDWSDLVSGRSTAASCPPSTLTVSTTAAGELVISTMGYVLLRLRNGAVVEASPIELDEGATGDFLAPAAQSVYADACVTLKRSRFAEGDSDDHPRQLYYATLLNILRRTDERRHGGSFIIVPDELDTTDARLADRVSIKYLVDTPDVWPDLVNECVATREFYERLFPDGVLRLSHVNRSRKREDPTVLYRASRRLERRQQKIRDFELFVASLSGVDGAVVLTRRLKVIGFGGEITATSPTLATVRLAGDSSGSAGKDVPITTFGTRHRSVFRFCSSFEDALCFVVSQDGQVKGVKRVGPQVVIWNDVVSREQVL